MATMLLGMAFGAIKAVVVLAVRALAWAVRRLASLAGLVAMLLAGALVALGRRIAGSATVRRLS